MILKALAVLCIIAALVCFLVAAFNEKAFRPALEPLGLVFVAGALLCVLGPELV